MTSPTNYPNRTIQCIAVLVLQHMQDECGDGDACVTVSDQGQAELLRGEITRQCNWLKDCSQSEARVFHLSDMSNENIWITWDPLFDTTLPKWVGLRIRCGHWR